MSDDLVRTVARNVRLALEASAFESYRGLAKAAGVAPNTVRHVISPDSRAPGQRGDVSPRLDILDKLARAMGYEGWQLMQEAFDPANPPQRVLSRREADLYRRIEDLYRSLPPPKASDD